MLHAFLGRDKVRSKGFFNPAVLERNIVAARLLTPLDAVLARMDAVTFEPSRGELRSAASQTAYLRRLQKVHDSWARSLRGFLWSTPLVDTMISMIENWISTSLSQ